MLGLFEAPELLHHLVETPVCGVWANLGFLGGIGKVQALGNDAGKVRLIPRSLNRRSMEDRRVLEWIPMELPVGFYRGLISRLR